HPEHKDRAVFGSKSCAVWTDWVKTMKSVPVFLILLANTQPRCILPRFAHAIYYPP
ncbi:hypothetical protein MNBD_PLANCTO03-359, partial [hydrothermal vent metagenome]